MFRYFKWLSDVNNDNDMVRTTHVIFWLGTVLIVIRQLKRLMTVLETYF